MDFKEKLWNIFFMILFLSISLYTFTKLPINLIQNISIFEIIILVLATQRIIRLFVYDKIMEFLRDLFPKYKNSLCTCVNSLIGCAWCFGIWAALIIIILYYLIPYGQILVLLLAISTLASSFQLLMNLIGWSAELKKQKSQNFKK